MNTIQTQTLIIGGGIAGLWLLTHLRAQGHAALLVSESWGGGQTLASQGIIHGGTKYALTGELTQDALNIADMPQRWRQALAGQGDVDLSSVEILTDRQLLWTTPSISSRLTGFFASKLMVSRTQKVPEGDWPELFKHAHFRGHVYALDEPVLDISTVLDALMAANSGHLLTIDPSQSFLQHGGDTHHYNTVVNGESVCIQADQVVLAAGEGNEALQQNDSSSIGMQRRALHMSMVRFPLSHGEALPYLFAHALGASDKPLLTITTHRDSAGRSVWYMGGQPAESSANQERSKAIKHAQAALKQALPFLDLQAAEWATWPVQRAEPSHQGRRPDRPFYQFNQNAWVCWPVKLAYAPMLAQQLGAELLKNTSEQRQIGSVQSNFMHLSAEPKRAETVWDQAQFSRTPL